MADKYECALCHGIFEGSDNEEACQAEFKENFGIDFKEFMKG